MVAATAWDELAAELGTAASGYNSVLDELTSGPWVGPTSAQMISAVVPYVSWLSAVAGQAEESAFQARAAAAAFETAFMLTVPPPEIAANRVLLATLVATNFFGQNTPAIMATEAQYLEMWAQDATAMYGYAAASATATQFTPYQTPPNTTTPEALFDQAAAVTQAIATPAGNSGQTAAAAATPQLTSAATVPQLLQGLATGTYFTSIEAQLQQFSQQAWSWALVSVPSNWANPILKQTLQAYFGIGIANFGWSIGQQTFNGLGTTAGSGGAWFPTPQFAGLHLGNLGGLGGLGGAHTAGAVEASSGAAGKVGMLSVPANWNTPTAATAVAAMEETPAPLGSTGATGVAGTPGNALLRGMPTGAIGRRTAGYGYTNKYGFRYSVLTRPPSAG